MIMIISRWKLRSEETIDKIRIHDLTQRAQQERSDVTEAGEGRQRTHVLAFLSKVKHIVSNALDKRRSAAQ